MVAVIHQSSSLRNALNYNEHKVKAGVAACLEAGYYPVGPEDLNFYQKLRGLEMLAELNQRTKHNCLHVSLNFDPSEKLSDEVLKSIAEAYLEKIGFGGQPYLLYKHEDAGHPHLHLVTTNIKADGSAIRMNYLGKNKSEPARKAIEQLFGLVQADKRQQRQVLGAKPVNAARVAYGKSATKQAVSNVLVKVLKEYKYASLAELNAVLRQYNIVADRGEENSRVFRHGGLVYRVLDEEGNKVGVPIKASLFFQDATLKFLQERFEVNKAAKDDPKVKTRLKNMVDRYFLNGDKSLDGLVAALKSQSVDMVLRRNDEGLFYGVTYVDHQSKMVFNGSALGKAYSANALRERCLNMGANEGKKQNGKVARVGVGGYANGNKERQFLTEFGVRSGGGNIPASGLVDVLFDTGSTHEGMDWELKRTKKKKKKLRLSPG
ncbi:relaxase/mobilization nuclease domain-containing protein [Mucilaginibacter pedocola]|uniref:MobA/VirD2-like nuclease domain-containing protein n=1 Tax=Mucilaginibacter pedocola TaxID=1792845 RepID=A0A1S9PBJ0_9SPHI|nr:relaxase/mobilization nuclease domain-containing protein [Mucilaginibacter pedocola]OOQ58281.1 hypothetical protein BC343_11650 [Mucilaginibacter pedocola]